MSASRALAAGLLAFTALLPISWADAATPTESRTTQTLAARLSALSQSKLGEQALRPVREDWESARRRIRSDNAWQGWVRSIRSRFDEWIATERDRAEWVAGYPHDLIDPITGVPLRWSPEMTEPALGEPGTPQRKMHEAWAARVRAYNLDRIQEASRLFRLTGERQYADWAADQLDFYARHYALWPLQSLYGSRSRMLGQGLDEATATTRLIDAVRLLGQTVSPNRRTRWREMLFMPIVANLREAKVGTNNISLWHAVAVALVAIEYEDVALFREALDGPTGVRAVMQIGVTEDFIWYEGSLGYQTYVLRALAPLFVQAGLRGLGPELKAERLRAQEMLMAPLLLRFEDGMLPSPGDVTARLKAVDRDFLVEIFRALPSALGLAEAAKRRNWDTLLDPVDSGVTGADTLPEVQTVSLPGVRMALLRRQGWQVFLRYGQVTSHHSHEDALNHEIYYADTPLSTDPGTVLYGSALHESYFRRAVAHNIALVDGIGQTGWNPGELELFDTTAGLVAASQPRYRPDAAVRRELRIADGALIDRLTTRLAPTAPTARRLGFLFHTDCTLVLADGGADLQAAPPIGRGFSYWEQVTVRKVTTRSEGRLRCGARNFIAQWRWTAPGRLYIAQAPTTPLPRKRTAIYFETLAREAEVELRLLPVEGSKGSAP